MINFPFLGSIKGLFYYPHNENLIGLIKMWWSHKTGPHQSHFFFSFLTAAPAAHGSSPARGWIGATAVGCTTAMAYTAACGNTRSLTEWGQRSNLHPYGPYMSFLNHWATTGTPHSEFFVFCFCLFAISWATPTAYGGSQARGQIRAVATGLCQSHSNSGSEPCLQPSPKLKATPGH